MQMQRRLTQARASAMKWKMDENESIYRWHLVFHFRALSFDIGMQIITLIGEFNLREFAMSDVEVFKG